MFDLFEFEKCHSIDLKFEILIDLFNILSYLIEIVLY